MIFDNQFLNISLNSRYPGTIRNTDETLAAFFSGSYNPLIYLHGGIYLRSPGMNTTFQVEQVIEAQALGQVVDGLSAPEAVVADHHHRYIAAYAADLLRQIAQRYQFAAQVAYLKFRRLPHIHQLHFIMPSQPLL